MDKTENPAVVIMTVEIPGMSGMSIEELIATVTPILKTQTWFITTGTRILTYPKEEKVALIFYPKNDISDRIEGLCDEFIKVLGEVEILVSFCQLEDIQRQVEKKEAVQKKEPKRGKAAKPLSAKERAARRFRTEEDNKPYWS